MDKLTIHDMCSEERPYEKCQNHGVETLSDAELLAIFLRTGCREHNVVQLCERLLNAHPVHKGIAGLNYLDYNLLVAIPGIGPVKAVQIMCIAELSKRMSRANLKPFMIFDSPATIADYFMESTRYLEKEYVYLLLFDSKHRLIKEITLSEGTVNQSLVSSRDVYIEALKYKAVYIVLLHNHPSGDPEPSAADLEVTDRIEQAGCLLEIKLSDHIILGNRCYVSLAERGYIK